MFSSADGTFPERDAAQDQPWSVWPDFAAMVRCLLTDLWGTRPTTRAALARLLLPDDRIAEAFIPEER